MIQAFGLTSDSRKDLPPSVDDVSFEARAGRVTALLGTAGSGKTTTLRLMLELQRGCGITYFRGRPLHRIAQPSREVGVLLGDVPGHPVRTVRGHLRMLCAAAGLPARRADEVLEVVGLVSFRDERLGTLSRSMDRRLGLACVLLADPHSLVLDAPADRLSARESRWLHGVLRAHANQGGTVLFTTADPKEAARTADRVVTLERGRLVADQEAADFARHRLRPRVTVRSPHAARLGALLAKEARTARRSVEVVRETGNRLSVYGSTCADVGEAAFRHGILIHQLADEVGDMGAGAGSTPPAAPAEELRAEAMVTATPDGRRPPAVVPAAGKRQPSAAALTASAAAVPRSEGARLAGGEESAYAPSPAGGGSVSPRPKEPPVTTRPEEPSVTRRLEGAPVATCPGEPSVAGLPEDTTGRAGSAAASLAHPGAMPSVATRGTPSVTPRPDSASGTAHGLGAPLDLRAKVASPGVHAGSRLPAAGPGEEAPPTRPDGPDLTTGSDGPDITGHPDDPVALTGAAASGPIISPGGPARTNGSQPPGPAAGPDRTPATASLAPGSAAGSEARDSAAGSEARDSAAGSEARDSTTAPEARDSTTAPEARDSAAGSEARAAAPAALAAARASSPSKDPSARAEAPDGAAATTMRPGQPGAAQPMAAHAAAGNPSTGHPAAEHPTNGHPAIGCPAPAQPSIPTPRPAETATADASSPLPPLISVRSGPSPLRPLRYELRRAAGIRTGFLVSAAVLVCSALTVLIMGRMGHAPQPRLLAAWPRQLPLPPAALGAGLLGALAFGDEFRHPALAADRGTVPRRLGLLTAKLVVATATALMLALLSVGCNAEVLYAVYGQELTQVPGDWLSLSVSWTGLVVGCAWVGVLAAGVFRSTTAGLAAVLAVPVLVVPLVQKAMGGKAWNAIGLPARLRQVFLLQWPFGGDRYLAAAARMIAQPVGGALALTLTTLLCAYLLTVLRSRTR
ncbi:ATP-binding cassette domain-containing protein [Streptomyces sp. NPDC001292]|uniref:ABC transporter ATP-binding protein n=1 Tax=Streptomyces sp. NPDC001292 TaxID=3364558 RepID=UPI0036861FB7